MSILPETRIFGIGLSKTGTTSLHKALIALDQISLHWPRAYFDYQANTKVLAIEKDDTESLVGRFGSSGWRPDYWNAISNANEHEYPECDDRYPGSKFILTTREADSWQISLSRWWPHNRPGGGLRSAGLAAYMDRQRTRVWGTTTYDQTEMRRMYEAHKAAVLAYFADRPTDLLVLPLGAPDPEKWILLCDFLGLERRKNHMQERSIPYPRANVQDHDGTRRAKMIIRRDVRAEARGPEAVQALEQRRQSRREAQDDKDRKRGGDAATRRAVRRAQIAAKVEELRAQES